MNKLNIADWRDFKISELFEIKRPKSRSVKHYNDGTVPFVSSGSANNGVSGYIEPRYNEPLDKGNCITISPVDGSCFYQPADFLGRGGGGSSIILLYNNNLNQNIGLFIAIVLRKTLGNIYQYNDMGNSDSIKDEVIKLPVKDNEPDWIYMEDYIKALYFKEKERLSQLLQAV